jgi:hypothetical protein
MKYSNLFGVPLDPSDTSHVDAANEFNDFQLAIFGNPIYLGTDYPAVYKRRVPDYVPLTEEDLQYLKGTADFWGADAYTISKFVSSYTVHLDLVSPIGIAIFIILSS